MSDIKTHMFVEGKNYIVDDRGCWKWLGATDRNGYGTRRIGGRRSNKNWFAHRLSFMHFKGAFDLRLNVLHKCDNPGCVNPDHLFLGTQADNIKDMCEKGRNRVPHKGTQGEKHPRSLLTNKQVREIREKYQPRIVTQKDLAEEYAVAQRTIQAIVRQESWLYA